MTTKFGKPTQGSLSENTYGILVATQFLCKSSGRLKSLNLYLTGAGSYNARVAIYADNAGVPGALLAESGEVAISGAGWYNFTMPYIPVRLHQLYWLALQYNEDVIHHSYDGVGSHYTRAFAYAAFPDPFGAGSADTKTSAIYALYAEDRSPALGVVR